MKWITVLTLTAILGGCKDMVRESFCPPAVDAAALRALTEAHLPWWQWTSFSEVTEADIKIWREGIRAANLQAVRIQDSCTRWSYQHWIGVSEWEMQKAAQYTQAQKEVQEALRTIPRLEIGPE